jgi:hypothetical protein
MEILVGKDYYGDLTSHITGIRTVKDMLVRSLHALPASFDWNMVFAALVLRQARKQMPSLRSKNFQPL